MSNYSSLFRVLSPSRVQTKFEENSLPVRSNVVPIRYTMAYYLVLGEVPAKRKLDFIKFDFSERVMILRNAIYDKKKNTFTNKNIDENDLILWKALRCLMKGDEISKYLKNFDKPPSLIHIIVQPPQPATTGTDGGSLSIPMKRQAESQVNNREPVAPRVREFWNGLSKAQIVLKLPDNADNAEYTSEPLSKYMKVEGNEIVLDDNVMLNSQNELVFCNYDPVTESGKKITMDFVKFLRLCKLPDGIVYGISTQDILIKKSYLQMIEKIELDRQAEGRRGCVIIGTPGIGKTHFSLYLAFYITRRYNSDDIIYEQSFQKNSRILHIKSNEAVMEIKNPKLDDPHDCFYIADSVTPAPWKTKYSFVVTTPKHQLWHDFVKVHPRKYYAPIWSKEEIWHVWNDQYKNEVSEARVKELIERWGCIPRRVFVEHNDEPDLEYLVSKCDIFRVIKNDGGDLDNEYSGKVIHIIPNDDFTNKTYVPASAEVSEALYRLFHSVYNNYRHYETRAKDAIINLIRDLAGGAGGTFAGNFFEMLAHDVLRKELDLRGLELNRYDGIQEINSGYYNFPKIKNFESIDAIAPHCDGIHYLYQITTAGKHDTKVNGLSKLENHLGNLPIHLYFVVPDINNIFDNFHYQNYVTTKGGKYEGWNGTNEWIRDEIEQYVLEIKLNTC
ncbi:unnamed protein product [Rhizophagus irregularis]|nr:unnamed protein product [Rhizophagus irregularis]